MAKQPQSRSAASPNYEVPALDKGLDILETLATSPSPQTRAELARTLGRSPSEIFRMLDRLEKRRYIHRDPASGQYRLTLRLFELAHTHSPVDQLLRVAQPLMNHLAEEVGESCHITILHGANTIVAGRALSPSPVSLSVEVGHQLPVLHTVSGRLLLATLPAQDRDRLLHANPEFSAASPKARGRIVSLLEKLRAQGYAVADSEFRAGVDLAVLVGNPAVGVSAALAVPCMAGGANSGREHKLLPALLDCAARITGELGFSRVPG